MKYMKFDTRECLYENALSTESDIKDWRVEGKPKITFENKRLHLENSVDASLGDEANWVLWCPEDFPDEIIIQWEFWPVSEPGLCMIFFAASGRNGEDLFDPKLPVRNGAYPQYHSGSINALHLSYFRHRRPETRAFRTCNLRKSYGFHMVDQGADPLPPAEQAIPPYKMQLVKYKNIVQFTINDLTVLEWEDDGVSYGPVLPSGKIGIRQMAPMQGEYSNLAVYKAIKKG